MALSQLEVHEIVKRSVSKSVDIPEFQRDFVWSPEQVKKLVESLYRDYPIGSFLLWNSQEYQEAKTAEGTQASLWIVDGQQRITALCLVLGQKPYWWSDVESWNKALEHYDVMVNLFPDGNDHLEFALPNPIRRRDPHWISVRRVLSTEKVEDLTSLAQEIANQMSENPERWKELFGTIHARIQSLWQIRKREIPIVEINHEVEEVAEIFSRLNQEGTRVKEADVILALAAVYNPSWVREEYLPFRKKLEDRGWELSAGIFIRTLTGIGIGRARLKEVPRDFWHPDSLLPIWKEAKVVIFEVLKRLTEFGITSVDLLPSTNSLIPLFVLHHRWQAQPGYSFSRALRWFLLANWDGRYSGSAITRLNEDVRTIKSARNFNQALEALYKRLRVPERLDDAEFLNRYNRAGNRFLRLMLYLVLFKKGAQDLVDGTHIGYDKTGAPVTAGFQPQWHHIYPKSFLRESGISNDEIHSLANITVLNERTNVKKLANKPPWRYIQDYDIKPERLRAHLIPDSFLEEVEKRPLEEVWAVERYGDFLVERAQLLAKEANDFLEELDI